MKPDQWYIEQLPPPDPDSIFFKPDLQQPDKQLQVPDDVIRAGVSQPQEIGWNRYA